MNLSAKELVSETKYRTDRDILDSKRFFSRFLVLFPNKYFSRQYRLGLFDYEDLWDMPRRPEILSTRFLEKVRKEKIHNPERSLLNILLKFLFWMWLPGMIGFFLATLVKFTIPYTIVYFIDWLGQDDPDALSGAFRAALLIISVFAPIYFSRMAFSVLHLLNGYIMSILKYLVFDILKRRRPALRNYFDTGQISNMLSNDIYSIGASSFIFHFVFLSPLSIIVFSIMLFIEAGIYSLVALPVFILIQVIVVIINNLQKKKIKNRKDSTDQRANFIQNLVENIKVIKFSSWEEIMQKQSDKIRKKEVGHLGAEFQSRGLVEGLIEIMPIACTAAILLVLIWAEEPVTVAKASKIISFFYLMVFPLRKVQGELFYLISAKDSLRRIERVLKIEEHKAREEDKNLKLGEITFDNYTAGYRDPKIEILFKDMNPKKSKKEVINSLKKKKKFDEEVEQKKMNLETERADLNNAQQTEGNFEPEAKEDYSTIKNISLKIESGEFLTIAGLIGSGKTSLVLAILNDMVSKSGKVRSRGKIAYVSQKAYILDDTVRENILMGEEYDQNWYQEVITACQLVTDFSQFEEGDQTIVGTQGSKLSGGQKQRVNLARAVYSKSDIYLLDDTLSALDAFVGRKIIDEVLLKILGSKTRILVTHSLDTLELSDRVLLMRQGSVSFIGSFEEIKETSQFAAYQADVIAEEEQVEKAMSKTSRKQSLDEQPVVPKHEHIRAEFKKPLVKKELGLEPEDDFLKDYNPNKTPKFKGILDLFLLYLRYVIKTWLFFTILAFTAFVAIKIAIEYFLIKVVENIEESNNYKDSSEQLLLIYILIATIFIMMLLRVLLLRLTITKTSLRTTNELVTNLLAKSMNFFQTVPSGSIINASVKDVYIMDNPFNNFLHLGLMTISVLLLSLVMMVINGPVLIVPIILTIIGCYFLISRYSLLARHLTKLQIKGENKLIQTISEISNNLGLIRSLSKNEYFTKRFFRSLKNQQICFTTIYATGSYLFKLEFLLVLNTILFILFNYVMKVLGFDSWARVTTFVVTLNWMNRVTSNSTFFVYIMQNMPQNILSLARIEEIVKDPRIEIEGDFKKKKSNKIGHQNLIEIPEMWPNTGRVVFDNVCFKYAESLPLVLRNLSFEVQDRTKVGIVGRTGSGKSTLMLALTRLYQIESGIIKLDEIDVIKLPLRFFRSKLSIIPQEPVLMKGTLRKNIDPFGSFSDKEVLAVIKKTKYLETLGNDLIEDPLKIHISSGGGNLSMGQRQVICIARALICKPKILLMDEATANIDYKTDDLIQQLIRKEFENTTVLTIAHRINTIIDYDKIIVLEKGELIEQGKPEDLIKKKGSWFRRVAIESGEDLAKLDKQIKGENIKEL